MANTPLSAIKAFCIDCMGDQPRLVKECTTQSCPLWPYRLGKGNARRAMTEEQRQAAAERLKKAREAKNST